MNRYCAEGMGAFMLVFAGCGDDSTPMAAQNAAPGQSATSQSPQATAGGEGAAEEVEQPAAELYGYDRTGKRDPFRSFHWDRIRSERDRLAERGPLEQYDLSQLAVVAIVWSNDTTRALVHDPSGRAYIVSQGSRMGKNDGKVVKIDDNLVLVKETYYNFLAEKATRDVELRIRTRQGG